MRFCVLVQISKRYVSLWYQAGEKNFARFAVKGATEIPLYFYVKGNDFLFGHAARDRFLANDPDAFGNFFEIVTDPAAHFIMYDSKRPVKQLLYYAMEQCFSDFINTVLYKNDSIESYRPGFPLRFLFGPDVEGKEVMLVESLFSAAGYGNVATVSPNAFLFKALLSRKRIGERHPLLLLSGIDGILYLQLYKAATGERIGFLKLPGLGADPRVKILARLIVDYIQAAQSYLRIEVEKEVAALLPFAASVVGNLPPVLSGKAALSDGSTHYYCVKKSKVTAHLRYDSNDLLITEAVNELLDQNNIAPAEVCILLGNQEVSTPFFTERLTKIFPNVKAIGQGDDNEAMRILFAEIVAGGYTTPKNNDQPDQGATIRPPVPGLPARVQSPSPPPVVPPPPLPGIIVQKKTPKPAFPPHANGLSSLVRKTGIVIAKISPLGKVRIEMKEYDAKSVNMELPVGTNIRVTGIDGKKYLLVEKSGSPPLPFVKQITKT